MQIADLMTREVKTVTPGATLDEATYIMLKDDVGCVPVVDAHRRPVGIVTDRDVAMASFIEGVAPHRLFVRHTMTGRVYTCRQDDTAETAQEVMRSHGVRRVPVTDEQGVLVGLVSLSDVVQAATVAAKGKAAARTAVVETLGTISRPRFAVAPKAPQPKTAAAPRAKVATKKAATKRRPKAAAKTSKRKPASKRA